LIGCVHVPSCETSWHIASIVDICYTYPMSRPRIYTDEERKARKKAAHTKWRADNPDKARSGDKRRKDKQYAENGDAIRQKNSEWQKNNLAWRREYNAARRAKRKGATQAEDHR